MRLGLHVETGNGKQAVEHLFDRKLVWFALCRLAAARSAVEFVDIVIVSLQPQNEFRRRVCTATSIQRISASQSAFGG
jgi:hypothetical protein